jgi:hypothetical protein
MRPVCLERFTGCALVPGSTLVRRAPSAALVHGAVAAVLTRNAPTVAGSSEGEYRASTARVPREYPTSTPRVPREYRCAVDREYTVQDAVAAELARLHAAKVLAVQAEDYDKVQPRVKSG